MPPKLDKVVSVAQAAKLLALSEDCIRIMCRDGRLDATSFGGVWMIGRDSVDAEFERRYPDFQRKTEG